MDMDIDQTGKNRTAGGIYHLTIIRTCHPGTDGVYNTVGNEDIPGLKLRAVPYQAVFDKNLHIGINLELLP